MDIALAVEEIYPAADYRRADSYEELVQTWKDERKVPTLAQLEDAWIIVEARLMAEQDKIEQLDIARDENEIPINTTDFLSESALIQQLAYKIAWLEMEIKNITGQS